eukprot:TRINITY_DN3036_c0_g1_i1.p1 TRINITY_DN3036_c0_g1~~TRINITY_DN3036_c0_g1_i1.p1  ORF type:complete len:134 (+),score=28.86 TRINITY_DN3036_c0_g1_i1:50-403(+)
MSIRREPNPASKFDDSFEDYDDVGAGFSMFDFLAPDLPEAVRKVAAGDVSMDFDETVVLPKDNDPKVDNAKKPDIPGASLEESAFGAPEVSRISQDEPPSARMEIEEGDDKKDKNAT